MTAASCDRVPVRRRWENRRKVYSVSYDCVMAEKSVTTFSPKHPVISVHSETSHSPMTTRVMLWKLKSTPPSAILLIGVLQNLYNLEKTHSGVCWWPYKKVWIGSGIEGERGATLRAKAEGRGASGTWRWSELLTGERWIRKSSDELRLRNSAESPASQ